MKKGKAFMKPESAFEAFTPEDLKAYGSHRPGETRLWERIQLPEEASPPFGLTPSHPARFVIVGVPEDIGPRANLGQGGADGAWEAFLGKFLNIQENRFGIAERSFLAGNVRTEDLLDRVKDADPKSEEGADELRRVTAELDERVVPVIRSIVEAGKCPILIGGGHNNAYGNLRGTCEALRKTGHIGPEEGMACLNIDPHADLREAEGRHSGNGFTYAYEEGFMEKYAMLGLHRNYNPESILRRFDEAPQAFYPTYFEDMLRESEQDEALEGALAFLAGSERPLGLEIDLDSVAGMAVSAETPSGFHENAVRGALKQVIKKKKVSFLHLAEGAPQNKPGYADHVGKFLAYLASDAIRNAEDPV